MQILYLIRHGETDHNRDGRVQGHTESDLSDLGLEQAKRVRGRLDGVDIDIAYTSPLRRAFETCRLGLDASVPRETHDGLKEINLGEWEGVKASDLRQRYPEDVKNWFTRPTLVRIPGAETIDEFRDRVSTTIASLRGDENKGTLAIFAHGGVICTYLTHILGMSADDIWRFKIRNGSVTRVIFPQDKPRIDLLGDVHHLDGVLREPPTTPFRIFP
jgi:broad specificity phosphatase PhoE